MSEKKTKRVYRRKYCPASDHAQNMAMWTEMLESGADLLGFDNPADYLAACMDEPSAYMLHDGSGQLDFDGHPAGMIPNRGIGFG